MQQSTLQAVQYKAQTVLEVSFGLPVKYMTHLAHVGNAHRSPDWLCCIGRNLRLVAGDSGERPRYFRQTSASPVPRLTALPSDMQAMACRIPAMQSAM